MRRKVGMNNEINGWYETQVTGRRKVFGYWRLSLILTRAGPVEIENGPQIKVNLIVKGQWRHGDRVARLLVREQWWEWNSKWWGISWDGRAIVESGLGEIFDLLFVSNDIIIFIHKWEKSSKGGRVWLIVQKREEIIKRLKSLSKQKLKGDTCFGKS